MANGSCCRGRMMLRGKGRGDHSRGLSARKESLAAWYAATIIRLSAPRNNNSFLADDHCGREPPPDEIGTRGPGPGNGSTITSACKVSLDVYAIQRPSGENIGYASSNEVERNAFGSPAFQPDTSSPDIGRIISWRIPLGPSKYDRNLPLACQDQGSCRLELRVRRCGSPLPSARLTYKFADRSRFSPNASQRPPGVQTGRVNAVSSCVICVQVAPVRSYTHTSKCVPSETSIATRPPSGENTGLVHMPGTASRGVVAPDGSIEEMMSSFDSLGTYISVPVGETAKSALPVPALALTPSTTCTGAPLAASRSTSKGMANRDPCDT